MGVEATARESRVGRVLLPLGLLFLAVGFSVALVLPFLSLFLSTEVRAGPVRVALFLFVAPLSGVLAAMFIGWLSDRRLSRRALLIGASLAGFAGAALTAVVRDYWVLFGLTVTATAIAGSTFPQSFAYARQALQRVSPVRATLGISTLRMVFSVAFVAGPPLATVLLRVGGFQLVYGVAAVAYLVAAAIAALWLTDAGPTPPPTDQAAVPATPAASRRTLLLTMTAFTLLQCPLTLGVQALPLFLSHDLGGDVGDAGLILGLCAAYEIPLMLGLGMASARIPLRTLILAGAACGIAYFGVVTTASAVWVLVAAQLLNALFIAAVSSLGITYAQNLRPAQPGRVTTLFTNTFPIGAVLAGPLFGLAQHFGYRLAFGLGAALCTAGLLLLIVARDDRPT